MAFLFTTDKQQVCGMLAVPLNIAVNFTDQKFYRLKLRKNGKMPKFFT